MGLNPIGVIIFFLGGGGGGEKEEGLICSCLISITTEQIKSSFKVIITVGMSDANIS